MRLTDQAITHVQIDTFRLYLSSKLIPRTQLIVSNDMAQ